MVGITKYFKLRNELIFNFIQVLDFNLILYLYLMEFADDSFDADSVQVKLILNWAISLRTFASSDELFFALEILW